VSRSFFEQGASAEEIALRYDVLKLQDIYATLGYFLGHRQETQEYLGHDRHRSRHVATRNAVHPQRRSASV